MGERITASATELLNQASITADTYLCEAIQRIDKALGKGYAKDHPELIAAFMKVAGEDFRTAVVTQALQDAADILADAIKNRESA